MVWFSTHFKIKLVPLVLGVSFFFFFLNYFIESKPGFILGVHKAFLFFLVILDNRNIV